MNKLVLFAKFSQFAQNTTAKLQFTEIIRRRVRSTNICVNFQFHIYNNYEVI